LSYLILYIGLLASANSMPFVMDNNESFSSLTHAENMFNFGIDRDFGLTDEAYGPASVAHPYVYTHQGNFPRVFAWVLYVIGARSIDSQIALTLLTVGLASALLAYHFFSRVSSPLFGFVSCLTLITDYVLFAQWQVVTFRVWHGFFLFSSLLLVQHASTSKKWKTAAVLNFALLFYFEYVFAAFVAIFCAGFAANLYLRKRQWRALIHVWVVEAAGAMLSVAIIVTQLVAYLGWSGFWEDAYLTYISRNGTAESDLRGVLQQFYATHNIVFWYNILDSSSFRNVPKFFELLFQRTFQVHTPVLSLIALSLFAGWLLGLPRWPSRGVTSTIHQRMRLAGARRWETALGGVRFGGWVEMRPDMGRIIAVSVRMTDILRIAVVGLGCYLIFVRVFRDRAFVGLQPAAPEAVWWTGGGPTTLAAAALALVAAMALIVHGGRQPFGLRRVAAAGLAAVIVVQLIDGQWKLYEQAWKSLWLDQLEGGLPLGLERAGVITAVSLALLLAFVGTETLIGAEADGELRAAASYLGCGMLAYAAVYVLTPGYVFSGYLVRSAPLPVFVIDVLLAFVVFLLLRIAARALHGLHAVWLRRSDISGSPPAGAFEGGRLAAVSATFGAATLVLVFFGGWWTYLQLSYLALLPPTHFAFLSTLASPPFKGSSFAVSTYAAPIADFTGQWAYFDALMGSGKTVLTPEGYVVERDTESYLWFADRASNPAYLKPDYYACMIPQDLALVVARLSNTVSDISLCSRYALVKHAIPITGPDQEPLQNTVVAADPTGQDSWAIVKLDWDYPPYLRPLSRDTGAQAVDLRQETSQPGRHLRVVYHYAQQDGKPEQGTTLRLYIIGQTGATCLIQESTQVTEFELGATVSGLLQASVTPRTATKNGTEYFSQPLRIEAAGEPGDGSTCS
jgi:hypothetical protein